MFDSVVTEWDGEVQATEQKPVEEAKAELMKKYEAKLKQVALTGARDLWMYFEPYDYNYRGQGFYIYPFKDFNSYDSFQDRLAQDTQMFGKEVEEWELVDCETRWLFDLGQDGIGLSETQYEGIAEIFQWCADNRASIDDTFEFINGYGYRIESGILDTLEDAYNGEHDNMKDFAFELIDGVYGNDLPEDLAQNYFDFERFGYSLRVSGDLDAMFVDDWEYNDEYESEEDAIDALDQFEREHSDREIGEWYVYDVVGDLESALGDKVSDYFNYERFASDLKADYTQIGKTIWRPV